MSKSNVIPFYYEGEIYFRVKYYEKGKMKIDWAKVKDGRMQSIGDGPFTQRLDNAFHLYNI